MTEKIKVYSLFTGGGGLDIGFKEAGFNIIGASDIWLSSEQTMRLNFPNVPFICKDINTLTTEEILASTNNIYPDVIIGGPPCQGFSVMGDKNSADPRNSLFESYVRIVNELSPKCFVFENVKGIKTMFNGRYLNMVVNSFAAIGYDIYLKILNSSNFGVPQLRERVIIFGTKLDSPFNFPIDNKEGIGKLKSYKNVGDAINDLVGLENKVPNHIPLNHKDIVLARYKLIPEGGCLPKPEDLPKEIRRKNFGSTYVRLHRDNLAPTMVPGNNAFPIHPTLHRSLTPREAARIQSFPDSHVFIGTRKDQCTLVGNAVPPLMSAKIAMSVSNHINSITTLNFNSETPYLKRFNKITVNETKTVTNKKALCFIDLFSGAGGIGLGFERAGFKHIFSADFDSGVAKTFRHNYPNVNFIEGDLSSEETFSFIKEKYSSKSIDLIVGGPPCQGFSMFGKRRFVNSKDYSPHDDERNKLIYTYFKYIALFKPKWFVMENVPGILTLDEGSFLSNFISKIEKLGYLNHDYKIINTADFGVPQQRKRFILIANRTNNIIPWPKPKFFDNPEDWQKQYRTINEVIVGLDSENSYSLFSNHKPMAHSEEVIERFSYIQEGEKLNPQVLPEHLRYSRSGKEIKSFSKVFYRLDRNKPSPTLVPGHSAFPIHPWLNRQLTVREAARIQTFPDSIEFLGTHSQQCTQVGNAFPPLAAELIANSIYKAICNNWTEENISTLAYYALLDK